METSGVPDGGKPYPVASFTFDKDGRMTFSENVSPSRLGFLHEFSPDTSIFDLYEDNPQTVNAVRRAFLGHHATCEVSINEFVFLNTFCPLVDVNGNVASVIGVSFDVTDNKRVEEELRKSEYRFRTLYNAASDAIFLMDKRTFVDCNDATLRIFQCTREQIVGQTPYRFWPLRQPDGRLSEESAITKITAALAGTPQFFEWRHIRFDGTPFDAEVSLNRLVLKDEVFLQAMVRDVSARKQTESDNKQLALVANITTNMVMITNGIGHIEWVNPAFTRITGYSLQEVVGRVPGEFLRGPETDKEMASKMDTLMRAGKGFKDFEIVNYRKDGTPYWVSLEVQPILDKSGKVTQFISIETDITDRKSTQESLLNRHEELMKTNSELDRFVYSASHDLRAPIASLLGLVEVARLERNPESLDKLFDMQKRSLLRLDRFIRDIVDHSRNTRLDVESEAVNFQAMVHSTFEQLQFMEHVNRIKKIISVKQEVEFHSSPSRLTIVLNNLISNAIKYADVLKRDPYLKIDIEANEIRAVIQITDNGEGIPKESLPKIFDMFFRASSRAPGSGLGLYIVKEAVQKIGGTIEAHSLYGEGTNFIVTIPNQYNPATGKNPFDRH